MFFLKRLTKKTMKNRKNNIFKISRATSVNFCFRLLFSKKFLELEKNYIFLLFLLNSYLKDFELLFDKLLFERNSTLLL